MAFTSPHKWKRSHTQLALGVLLCAGLLWGSGEAGACRGGVHVGAPVELEAVRMFCVRPLLGETGMAISSETLKGMPGALSKTLSYLYG